MPNILIFIYSTCKIYHEHVVCECPDEMDLAEDMKTCLPIDPCHIDNGGCSHYCDSALEPNICYCPSNYVLDDDGRSCLEETKCKNGFTISPDDGDCRDIDECSEDPNICLNGVCQNNEGSYECLCHNGYYLSQHNKSCLDIDECENSPCSHRCLNLPGTYQCMCSYAQVLMADGHTCGELL
jgi:hypothetical protein